MFSDESYLLLSNFWQFTAPEDVNLFFIPLKRVSQSKNSLSQSEAAKQSQPTFDQRA